MNASRRMWLAGAMASASGLVASSRRQAAAQSVTDQQLRSIDSQPVLQLAALTEPVRIRSMELLHGQGEYLVRVRTDDGQEGIAVANPSRLRDAYPIFLNRVAPFFPGKDARVDRNAIDRTLSSQQQLQVAGTPLLGLRGRC